MEDAEPELPPPSPLTPSQRKSAMKKPTTTAKPAFPKTPHPTAPPKTPSTPATKPHRPKLQSELQRGLKVDSMVKKVMQTSITLTLRELLGSAPDVSKQIHEYMKLTRPKVDHAFYANLPIPNPYYEEMQDTDLNYDCDTESNGSVNHINSGAVAAITPGDKSLAFHRQDARLICIKMQFPNGLMVNAVIDSGSELDIVKDSVYEQTGLPIDMTESTMMNDINQNKKMLQGRLHNVKLTSGTLVTTTGLWVAPLPFALLLG
jgi:hypothetical protein